MSSDTRTTYAVKRARLCRSIMRSHPKRSIHLVVHTCDSICQTDVVAERGSTPQRYSIRVTIMRPVRAFCYYRLNIVIPSRSTEQRKWNRWFLSATATCRSVLHNATEKFENRRRIHAGLPVRPETLRNDCRERYGGRMFNDSVVRISAGRFVHAYHFDSESASRVLSHFAYVQRSKSPFGNRFRGVGSAVLSRYFHCWTSYNHVEH